MATTFDIPSTTADQAPGNPTQTDLAFCWENCPEVADLWEQLRTNEQMWARFGLGYCGCTLRELVNAWFDESLTDDDVALLVAVFGLGDNDPVTQKEIAVETGCTPSTLYRRLTGAIERLHELIIRQRELPVVSTC